MTPLGRFATAAQHQSKPLISALLSILCLMLLWRTGYADDPQNGSPA